MTWKLQGQSRIMRNDEVLTKLAFEVTFVDGKSQNKLISEEPFNANVQPMSGRDLLLVPEHQRFLEQYWCFVPLKKSVDQPPTPIFNKTGEVVHRNGIHYQVQSIDYWGSYQRLRIMRVDVGDYATP